MEPEPLSKRSAPTVTLNPHPPKMFPEKFIGFVEVEVEQRWYFFFIPDLCHEYTPGSPPVFFFDRNPQNFPAILDM